MKNLKFNDFKDQTIRSNDLSLVKGGTDIVIHHQH